MRHSLRILAAGSKHAAELEHVSLVQSLLQASEVMTPLETSITNSTDLAERTKDLYLVCVKEFLGFAGKDPEKWTVGKVEDFLTHLLSPKRNLARSTVRVYRKAIRYASRRYAKRGGVDFAHLADSIKAPPVERDDVLDENELEKLLDTCGDRSSPTDLRDYVLIVVAARTGLRRGGLHALNWSGVDFKRGMITTRQKGGGTITFEADEVTLQALKTLAEDLPSDDLKKDHPVFCVVKRQVSRHHVDETMTDIRLSEWKLWDVFRSRAAMAGIRHVHPHLMRHSTVTWLRDAGVSSMDVRRLTGQTEKTVEDIYTHSRRRGAVGTALGALPGKKENKR